MNFICPKCKTEIQSENINIATDLAKCQNCGEISKASELSKQKEPVSKTPPAGSKIELIKGFGDEVEFILPKTGFNVKSIPLLVFAIIWISFVAFWTLMASRGSIIFAAFSIPFWLVGFSMLYGILKTASTSQSLKIDRLNLKLIKKSILGKKTFECSIPEILAINFSKPNTKNPLVAFSNIGNVQKQGAAINLPNLVTIQTSIPFFESANKDEQQWIVDYLNQHISHLKN